MYIERVLQALCLAASSISSTCLCRFALHSSLPCSVPHMECIEGLLCPLVSFGFSQWEEWREDSEVSAFIHVALSLWGSYQLAASLP